jgi:hypothetical protein
MNTGASVLWRRLTSEPVTPSEEVDEVWHFHLTYTSDYWDVWCQIVLGRPLHHYPTRGDADEDSGFRSQYVTTLARYERFFWAPASRILGAHQGSVRRPAKIPHH